MSAHTYYFFKYLRIAAFAVLSLLSSAVLAAEAAETHSHSHEKEAVPEGSEKASLNTLPQKRESIAVIVNDANELTNLSLKQLELIFSGDTADWRTVSEKEQHLRIFMPDPENLPGRIFQDKAMSKRDYRADAIRIKDQQMLLAYVASHDNAIAIKSFPFPRTEGIKVLAVDGIPPNAPNYPIAAWASEYESMAEETEKLIEADDEAQDDDDDEHEVEISS